MKRFFTFAVVSLFAGLAGADDGNKREMIAMGVAAYVKAQSLTEHDARIATFANAERFFEEAARSGNANADLYANVGIAALQAERIGPAVLAFRRALAMDPDHSRSQRNLTHARNLLPAWVPKDKNGGVLDTFFLWHRTLSTNERATAGAVCFLVAALAFSIAIRWVSRLARGAGIVFSVTWLGLITSVALESYAEQGRHAVIIAEETVARASDSVNAPARFSEPLPGGTEMEVVERRARWARIRLANGREAWINGQSLKLVSELTHRPARSRLE